MRVVFVLAERAFDRVVVRALVREHFPLYECVELSTPVAARNALTLQRPAICVAASTAIAALDPATAAILAELGGRRVVLSQADLADIGALSRTLPKRFKAAMAMSVRAQEPNPEPGNVLSAKPPTATPSAACILVASSTGGPTALLDLLGALPSEGPPWVVAQHMPASGAQPFANHISARTGREAIVVGGPHALADRRIHLLEGGRDYGLTGRGRIEIRPLAHGDSPFHPNADRLFASAAELNVACVAIVLSGMGRDGAGGCARLAAAGSTILAQRPDTCIVPGMPEAARSSAPQAIFFDPVRPPDLLIRLCATPLGRQIGK